MCPEHQDFALRPAQLDGPVHRLLCSGTLDNEIVLALDLSGSKRLARSYLMVVACGQPHCCVAGFSDGHSAKADGPSPYYRHALARLQTSPAQSVNCHRQRLNHAGVSHVNIRRQIDQTPLWDHEFIGHASVSTDTQRLSCPRRAQVIVAGAATGAFMAGHSRLHGNGTPVVKNPRHFMTDHAVQGRFHFQHMEVRAANADGTHMYPDPFAGRLRDLPQFHFSILEIDSTHSFTPSAEQRCQMLPAISVNPDSLTIPLSSSKWS